MKCAVMLMSIVSVAAQQPRPFELLWSAYQEREKEWNQADEELRAALPTLDPCAAETRRRILAVRGKSDAALDASVEYYRSWRGRNEAILRFQMSSARSAAAELERIRVERDHTIKELASLKNRAAAFGAWNAGGEGRLASLRQLIESVEDNLRRWDGILRELETENPERRKTILREKFVVASIDETIGWVEQQRRYYDLVYDGRIDASRKRCLSGGRK